MNDLTLGQRIAARRKLLNLSQESLAERLDISRQSVSKWESDAAIPEIDKLIALSKLYSVSIGWLLGVEDQENPASDELSESQLKMVEEIVRRYQLPRRNRIGLIFAALTLCFFAVFAGLFFHSQRQTDQLTAENTIIQSKISALSQGNADIQNQINQMDALLRTQKETGKLLRSYVPMCHLNVDLETVDITFYFFPKVYHHNLTAYLSVFNPSTKYSAMLECRWVEDRYLVHATLPLADHYHYSFLLVSDMGYEEEILDSDTYFTDLSIHSGFYIAEDHPKYTQMKTGQSSSIGLSETNYCYDAPIYMPNIQEQTGFVPFDDVKITLSHNETVIWEADYSNAFLALYKQENITVPLNPDIQVELPPLVEGDRLLLQLTATTHTGRILVSTLDDLTVVNS